MASTKGTNSAAIDNDPFLPSDLVDQRIASGVLQISSDTAAVADGDHDADGDVILLCPIPSGAVIHKIEVLNDDLDAGTDSAVNVGLYNGPKAFTTSSGTEYAADALLDEDCFASAVTFFQAAQTEEGEAAAAFEARNITAHGNKAYEDAGLSEDPNRIFQIGFTQTATVSTDAAGDVTVKVYYTR